MDAKASTFVESYPGGKQPLEITVYFQHGCEDCEEFENRLGNIALRAGLTLVATFRNLEDPDNRAALSALTDRQGPTPIVVIGDEVIAGQEEIDSMLDAALAAAKENSAEKSGDSTRIIILLAVAVAGAGLAALLFSMRAKKRA